MLLLLLLQLTAAADQIGSPATVALPRQAGDVAPGARQNPRAFIAYLSTSTYSSVSLTTSVVFFTCVSGTVTAACSGRRRRRRDVTDFPQNLQLSDRPAADLELFSSHRQLAEEAEVAGRGARIGRLLQVTSTVTATLTLVTTSINSATTVSVSILCTGPTVSLIPACG